MTLEKPRTPTPVNLPLSMPVPPMIQQTVIWVDPDAMPHCYGDKTGVSISFGAGNAAWRIIIDPAVFDGLKHAIGKTEEMRKDLPKPGEWQKIRLRRYRWQFWK